ncbi:thiol peroxidase [Candidatus Viridilinea mediisalina]|uniref:Lipid hydroperoxide peroxidase n=1 Tax=Candidatus Viridilinea mediisalina TaxID=2024553 RepID=A0A2A6RPY4_9CHLR|nr:thiol peroxidase [Candidatus Viridilinea mediisalina]PDW04939.1 lipid hydroperoxide peroxidase [Candidatus Viridilinea mediisalina]
MSERAAAFDFFGPRALVGPELAVGQAAPAFTLLNSKLKEVTLADFAGKPLILSVVPSLDTGVCSKQSVRFNTEAVALADQVNVVTVSADLPFAQARWCSSSEAKNLITLSDHREMSFAQAYGTYLKDFRLNSRAVFLIDGAGIIQYAEYVPQAGQEPDYDALLAALRPLLG